VNFHSFNYPKITPWPSLDVVFSGTITFLLVRSYRPNCWLAMVGPHGSGKSGVVIVHFTILYTFVSSNKIDGTCEARHSRYNWESHISNINAQVHRCIIFSPNGQFNHIENAQYRIQYYYIINTQPHGSSSSPFPSAIWSKSKIVILSHTQNSLPLTAERVLLPVSPKLLTALQATTSLDRANVSCILSDNVRHCCSPIVAYSVATFPRVTLGFGIFKPTKPENVS